MQAVKTDINLVWEGIPIVISYQPKYSDIIWSNQIVSHIEIRAAEPLPITETGYRSIFFFQEKTAIMPCVKAQILTMLQEESQTKKWKNYWKNRKQLQLF